MLSLFAESPPVAIDRRTASSVSLPDFLLLLYFEEPAMSLEKWRNSCDIQPNQLTEPHQQVGAIMQGIIDCFIA
jgi:hypothetical protein